MKIISPSVKLIYITPNALELIEQVGRICYKSEERIAPGTAEAFVTARMDPKNPHTALLEFADAVFVVTCDRGVTHEIVRHRVGSYAQESTRYCNYTKGKFGGAITVIEPPTLSNLSTGYANPTDREEWLDAMETSEEIYNVLINKGIKPQIARSVLPNALKTEIAIKYNFREWLHFFSLRCAPTVHPQMQEVAKMMQKELQKHYPSIFGTPNQDLPQ